MARSSFPLHLVMAILLASSSGAYAQRATGAPVSPSPEVRREKSPWVATGLAVGVTVGGLGIGGVADSLDPDASSPMTWIGLGIGYAALAAGPSTGHWYAGEGTHVLTWTAIRGAGLAAAGGGICLAFDAHDDDRAVVPGVLLATAGTVVFTVGLYWDLVDAHRAAHRANRRARQVSPTITAVPLSGGGALTLSGAF